MTLAGHNRYDYAPITARPAFKWPEGKGLTICIGINLEHFAFGEGPGAELVAAPAFSDLVIDTFNETLAHSTAHPFVLGPTLHPCIAGKPARLRHLPRALSHDCGHRNDIRLTTAEAIAQSYTAQILPPDRSTHDP